MRKPISDARSTLQLRTVVLLNLGSLVDLADYFGLPEQATLHVIDSHRPYNLDNLFSAHPEAERIVLWDDGDVEEDMKEERTAFEALQVRASRTMRLDLTLTPHRSSTSLKATLKKNMKTRTMRTYIGASGNDDYSRIVPMKRKGMEGVTPLHAGSGVNLMKMGKRYNQSRPPLAHRNAYPNVKKACIKRESKNITLQELGTANQ